MLKNFILNLSFVKQAISDARQSEKISGVIADKERGVVLGSVNEQIADLESKLMSNQEEVEKLTNKNENSERKISSLSEENEKLREDLSKGTQSLEHPESVKEIMRRNGTQSQTIHNMMLEISKLNELVKNKNKNNLALMG